MTFTALNCSRHGTKLLQIGLILYHRSSLQYSMGLDQTMTTFTEEAHTLVTRISYSSFLPHKYTTTDLAPDGPCWLVLQCQS